MVSARTRLPARASSGIASPKFFWGKCLTLGEQQYFCLGHHFSEHKMLDMLKNSGGTLATPMGPSRLPSGLF